MGFTISISGSEPTPVSICLRRRPYGVSIARKLRYGSRILLRMVSGFADWATSTDDDKSPRSFNLDRIVASADFVQPWIRDSSSARFGIVSEDEDPGAMLDAAESRMQTEEQKDLEKWQHANMKKHDNNMRTNLEA